LLTLIGTGAYLLFRPRRALRQIRDASALSGSVITVAHGGDIWG
jgi:hypothetical protein